MFRALLCPSTKYGAFLWLLIFKYLLAIVQCCQQFFNYQSSWVIIYLRVQLLCVLIAFHALFFFFKLLCKWKIVFYSERNIKRWKFPQSAIFQVFFYPFIMSLILLHSEFIQHSLSILAKAWILSVDYQIPPIPSNSVTTLCRCALVIGCVYQSTECIRVRREREAVWRSRLTDYCCKGKEREVERGSVLLLWQRTYKKRVLRVRWCVCVLMWDRDQRDRCRELERRMEPMSDRVQTCYEAAA